EQRAEDRRMARLLEHEAKLLDMEDEFEAEQEMLDFQREQELLRLGEEHEQGLLSEENYLKAVENLNKQHAEAQKEIDQAIHDNKIMLASKTLASLATIMGEETQAGKFFASAQALVDTYSAATSAYKAMAGIPVIGPALGAAAAGTAVATGLRNIQKINQVRTQKYTGGPTPDGGMFTRTGYVHAGEVVFSQQDVRQMGGADAVERLRPTSNQFGKMPTGLSGDNDNMINWRQIASIMGQEVRRGSQIGTGSGIIEANDNAEVRRSAQF
ncbi:MAG TPA: hypothetical protein VK031_08485, partial [Tissierellaceae bacterium]|nr:hypothetical protein [Tissierellaceae bacterium]